MSYNWFVMVCLRTIVKQEAREEVRRETFILHLSGEGKEGIGVFSKNGVLNLLWH